MRLPVKKASAYGVAFLLFVVAFAYLLLTDTRRVDGRSMYPTLEEGDLVVIQPASATDLHIGDIIVYGSPCSNGGISVIHRVVDVRLGGFATQGDNNPSPDQDSNIALTPIFQNCLIGRVVFVVPYIERLASLPYGLNYLLAMMIFLAIIYSELSGRRTANEHKHEEDKSSPATLPPAGNVPIGIPDYPSIRERQD